METQLDKKNRSSAFFSFVINCIKDEKRKNIVAALRRADNPSTEYQSWEYLAAFNIKLDKSYERLPFASIV